MKPCDKRMVVLVFLVIDVFGEKNEETGDSGDEDVGPALKEVTSQNIKGFTIDDSNWKIKWHGNYETDLLKAPDMENILMLTKDDEQYNCRMPREVQQPKEKSPEYSGPNAMQLLEPLYNKGSCSYRLESYWTYEVCHGAFIRQYHEAKEGRETKLTEYFLGRFSQEMFQAAVVKLDTAIADGTAEAPKTLRIEDVDLPYLEVVYTHGTVCDLTGKPRETSVRYVCHAGGRHEMVSFQETSSCQYVIVVLSPLLCLHPHYKVNMDVEHSIHCVALANSPKRPRALMELDAESLLAMTHHLSLRQVSDSDTGAVSRDTAPSEAATAAPDDSGSPDAVAPPADEREPPVTRASPVHDQKLVDDFLAGRHCLNGGTGWWRYEFCYGRRVDQFHVNSDGSRTTIHLGYFDVEDHRSWLRSYPHKRPKEGPARKHVSHFYSGGSHCDEVAAPRSVEVKLKCKLSDSPNAVSLYLLEPRTCEYVLGVESPIVCGLLDTADDDGLFVERPR